MPVHHLPASFQAVISIIYLQIFKKETESMSREHFNAFWLEAIKVNGKPTSIFRY